jgi:hypothetical protein
MSRWLGLAALVAVAVVGLYVAHVETRPPKVLPGELSGPSITQFAWDLDGGSLDNLIDATKIEHAIGGR